MQNVHFIQGITYSNANIKEKKITCCNELIQ